MKKLLIMSFTALLVLGGSTSAFDSRHPLEDAQRINDDPRSMEIMLNKYITSDSLDIAKMVRNNYFLKSALKDDFTEGFEALKQITTPPDSFGTPHSSLPAKLGLISPTTAIDAIGTFVARRFKEELNIAYLNRFKEDLAQNEDLRLLLPTTHALLVAANPYNYPTFLESLRAALDNDLQNLLKNLPGLLQRHEESITNGLDVKDGYPTVMLLLNAVNSLSEAKPPAEVIVNVANDPVVEKLSATNIRSALKLLGYVVEEFTIPGTYDWANTNSLGSLEFAKIRYLFIGLFLEKYRDRLEVLQFVDANGVTTKSDFGQVEKIGTYVNEVRTLVAVARREAKVVSNFADDNERITHEVFNQFTRSLLVVLEQGVQLHRTFGGSADDTFVSGKLIPILIQMQEISEDIAQREYGKVHVKVLALLSELFPEIGDRLAALAPVVGGTDAGHAEDRTARVRTAMSASESDSSPASDSELPELARLKKLMKQFVKYGSLAVNIATAEGVDEIVEILETAALPVGSYRIKRHSDFNVSINAYMGGFVGSDRLLLKNNEEEFVGDHKHFGFGFTAPIGVAFSTQRKFLLPRGWSKSVFLSVIDIGAVAAFRLQDETSDLPETEFQNVLAPGGYVVVGIKGSPLSVGLGAQYGPQLRKIDLVTGNELEAPAWRLAVFIAVDIPILNLHTGEISEN